MSKDRNDEEVDFINEIKTECNKKIYANLL